MNLSLKNTDKTGEMMRKVGLEADSGVRRVILLQGFATRSLQFNIFLTAIIWLYTAEASIMFSHRKKSLRRFELKDGGYYGHLPVCIVERTKGRQSRSEPEKEPNTRNNIPNNPTGRIKGRYGFIF